MSLTLSQLKSICPSARDPEALVPAIVAAWDRFGFTTRQARAAWFGIVGNETGGLAQIGREDMRYSAERAFELFPKARQHPEVCRDRCSSVRMDKGRRFASWIYADLYGNGDEASEDGWDYRGGGMTQLTFRSAYASCGAAIDVDLVGDPELIVTPRVAALSSCWFMAAYKPQILRLFRTGGDADFLAGGRMVGWTTPEHTARRLAYRGEAMEVLDGDDMPMQGPVVRLLHRGVQPGPDVGALEAALAGQGLYRGVVDNDFDALTEAAVIAFQRRTWPTQPHQWDGVVGRLTREQLGLAA